MSTTTTVLDGGRTAPPRWAERAALLTVLTTVPSALWRLAFAIGIPVGADPGYRQAHYPFPGWGTVYLLGLTVLLVGLALLTYGLVRPWGEVLPRWMPLVGGRRVPPRVAITAAGTGALALTLLWIGTFSSVGVIFDEYGLHACYVPLLLWGPLLAAVTVSYARRARRAAERHHVPSS